MASSMSPFSSSSPSSHYLPKKYDVFISFRGEDTRFNFTSHLHEALCRNKIETFIDYDLERGEKVWGSLEKAIEDSSLFLIVFSENYASSTWCLMELTKILECAKGDEGVVFPVFYKIEPAHVRKQLGSCEIAFAKHENGIHKEHVHQWREALTEAANLAGWDSNVHRNEAKLIEEIAQCIIKKLSAMSQTQSVYMDGLVGIDDQISHLESLICKGLQDVRYIGIWGIGGIGKTTIATLLFNKLCSTFESFCFLANVREESEKYGMSHLENKLISTLLEGKESNIGMHGGAFTFVHRRLGRKKVLVVLDDVSDLEQLRYLAERPNWFGEGSRIIITTRDKQLLSKNIDDDDIYEVQPMEFHEALKLFNLNAFKNNCPTNMEFEKLSHGVVSYAKGIPLAIIVLGGILCGKGEKEWRSQLEKLKKMPCAKVHQILKLSYEGLDYEEKNIFLDVACFFKGRMVEKIENLLDACGNSTIIGLRSLQDKALLTISNEIVSMHDLIQQMGREIVREESFEEPGKRSRLWNPNDIYQVLKENKGSEAIRGISLDVSKIEDLILNPQVFAKMSNLKFLEIYDSNSNGHSLLLPQGLKSLSNELRYLRWDKWPLKSLPLAFSAESLVELQMQDSGIKKLWHGIQNVVNLKAIDLCHSTHLIELPDFSKAFNLEKAHLNNCSSLRKVHQSILSLQKLQVLELEQRVSLTSLTSDSQLTSLHHLSLSGCSRLKEFSIPSQNLRFLNLFKTAINEWPSSMGPLFKLEHLDLRWCKGLKNLPSNFFNGLHSLQELWLDGCSNMIELPQNMIDLCSLRQLSIAGIAIQRLPESMKHLSSLSYF